jgi:HSP20 family protein
MTIIKFRNRPVFPNLLDEMMHRGFVPGFDPSFGNLPASNILEKDQEFVIEIVAPGLEKEDFKLQLENKVLSVSYEPKEDGRAQEQNYLLREMAIGSFTRSFTIPDTIDKEKISATYHQGVLKISVPKNDAHSARLARNIEIA